MEDWQGYTVKFWKDHWIIDRCLIHHEGTLYSETVDYSVASFVGDGWWDIGKLRDVLSENLVEQGQILDAEKWGLAFGLKLAVDVDHEVSNVILEMDSATTVLLIQSPDVINFHPFAGVICSCKEYMEKINNCVVKHISQEKNCVADCLASSSYHGSLIQLFIETR